MKRVPCGKGAGSTSHFSQAGSGRRADPVSVTEPIGPVGRRCGRVETADGGRGAPFFTRRS